MFGEAWGVRAEPAYALDDDEWESESPRDEVDLQQLVVRHWQDDRVYLTQGHEMCDEAVELPDH